MVYNNGLEKRGLYSAYDIYNDGIVIIEKNNDYTGELMMVLKKESKYYNCS